MKTKQLISGILALSMVCGLTACGSEEVSVEETTITTTGVTINTAEFSDEDKEMINKTAEEKISGELENKTIKWMANWDINPDNTGKSKSAQLTMFEEKFGGVVEYYPTTFENQYSDLSTAILGGEGIDFFPIGSLDSYISGTVSGMYQPIDEYVDFNNELWGDVKDIGDKLMINGKHYALLTEISAGEVVIYNRSTFDANGLEDPADLFAKGEWTWDTYRDLLSEFVDNDSGMYGIDGWWIEQPLYLTTGKSLISIDNCTVTYNIR